LTEYSTRDNKKATCPFFYYSFDDLHIQKKKKDLHPLMLLIIEEKKVNTFVIVKKQDHFQ